MMKAVNVLIYIAKVLFFSKCGMPMLSRGPVLLDFSKFAKVAKKSPKEVCYHTDF